MAENSINIPVSQRMQQIVQFWDEPEENSKLTQQEEIRVMEEFWQSLDQEFFFVPSRLHHQDLLGELIDDSSNTRSTQKEEG